MMGSVKLNGRNISPTGAHDEHERVSGPKVYFDQSTDQLMLMY
jgi:hypothetical protein